MIIRPSRLSADRLAYVVPAVDVAGGAADVHLKNWYIDADFEMDLNDWQCSCKGNWSRDLSYALATALTPDNCRAGEWDLVAYYIDQLQEAGAPEVPLGTAWSAKDAA